MAWAGLLARCNIGVLGPGDLSSAYPETLGVYIFRLPNGQQAGRVQGGSGIVYCGAANDLSTRLQQRAAKSRTQNEPLMKVLEFAGELEVGIITTPTPRMAFDLEMRLVFEYGVEHLETPPLNQLEPNGVSSAWPRWRSSEVVACSPDS